MSEWESLSNDISVHGYTPPKVTNKQLRKERDEALTELAEQRKKNASTTSLRQQRDRARSDGEIYRTDLLKLADKVVALRAQLAEALARNAELERRATVTTGRFLDDDHSTLRGPLAEALARRIAELESRA